MRINIVNQRVSNLAISYTIADPANNLELCGGKRVNYGKCGVLHFGGNNLRNGASCALDHWITYRKSHMANRISPTAGTYDNRKC